MAITANHNHAVAGNGCPINIAAPTAVKTIARGENAITTGEENKCRDFRANHIPTTPPVNTTTIASPQSMRLVDSPPPESNAIGTTMSIPITFTAAVEPHGPAPGLGSSLRDAKYPYSIIPMLESTTTAADQLCNFTYQVFTVRVKLVTEASVRYH